MLGNSITGLPDTVQQERRRNEHCSWNDGENIHDLQGIFRGNAETSRRGGGITLPPFLLPEGTFSFTPIIRWQQFFPPVSACDYHLQLELDPQ